MAIQRKEIREYLGKVTLFFIRTSYRSARDHPFVFGLVLFLLVLYKSFPSLFAFLVSSSPTIVCTTILLGLLLSYGDHNIPEIEEEDKRTWEVSSVEIESFTDHLDVNKDKNLAVQDHPETRNYNEKIEPREAILSKKARPDEDIYQVIKGYEGTEKLDTIMETGSSDEELKEGNYVEDKAIQVEEIQGQGDSNGDVHVGKLAVGLAKAGESVNSFGVKDNRETEGLKLESGEPPLDYHFDSSLGLPWQTIETHHVPSDTESDRAESSSPDASMTDIIPMLDELHPLLDSEHPLLALNSKSDAASEVSALDHESIDNSTDEEAENHGEEEDEEAQEKDDGPEAVKWTEDDLMNVTDLRSSELERNQRLESLIAKQREKKNLTFAAERNLIDLDVNSSFFSMDELSRFHVQVPPVSAPRKNPFDGLSDFEETMDLPPIPGSAPSSLVSRRNPFDLFYDLQEPNNSHVGESWGQQNFGSAPHHEVLLKRNETFSLGRREFQREKRHSRFKPYFVVENMDLEGSSTFQRQFSDMSASKVSSVPESDTLYSVTDEEYNGDLKEQEYQNETELSCLSKHDTETVEHPSHTSEEVKTVDIDEKRNEHVNDVQENGVEENSGKVMHLNVPKSDFEKSKVVEQKYDEPKSPFSSDNNDKGFTTSSPEHNSNLEQTRSRRESLLEPEILTSLNAIRELKVEEPVYHSSAPTNYFPKVTKVDDALPDAGQLVNVGSSVKFDVQKEVSETSSSTRPLEGYVTYEDLVSANVITGEFASGKVAPFTSSSDLTSAEENESASREITDVSQDDDAKVGESAIQEHFSHPASLITQEIAAGGSGLTGLQITDGSDIDASNFQNSALETGYADANGNLFHKIKDSSSSDIFPAIPIHHGSLTGLQLIELTESMDFSITSKMKSEIGIQTSIDLSRSRKGIASVAPTKHEVVSLKMVDSSDEESDEVHPVVLVDDEMDDNLQMELEEGVDFHIEELPSNHQVSEFISQTDGESQGVGSSRSILYTEMPVIQPCQSSDNQSHLISSVIDQSIVTESEIESSLGSTRNLDQTVCNTEIHVPDEKLVNKFDSASNQPLEKATVSIVSDSNIDIRTTAQVEPNEVDIAQRSIDQTRDDSELPDVEATSIEDIHSSSEQITEKSIHELKHHEVGIPQHLVAKQIQSDLVVIEAKSIEDISLALNQLSDSTSKKAPEPMKTEDGSLETNASERQLETEILEAGRKTSSSVEPFSEKTGVEAGGDVSISETSMGEARKKTKKSASGSSSSSSSDSSTSDSDEDKR